MASIRTVVVSGVLALVGCGLDDVDLEGLSCPCGPGWVCVRDVCHPEDQQPDFGPPDLGPPDLGPPDGGPPDLGPPDLGPPDLGEDGGPVEPVDCSPLMDRENTEFCGATRETCSAEAQNMTTCDDLCAAAGLVCLEANDDLNPECGPNLEAPLTCDDDTKVAYHCLCIRG